MDAEYVRKIAAKWFWDTDISVVAYGPLHRSAVRALHNRLFRRSTLGSWGSAQSRFV
jgi:UDP-2,3-diacylglucosamine pyrophosphatase LpxH